MLPAAMTSRRPSEPVAPTSPSAPATRAPVPAELAALDTLIRSVVTAVLREPPTHPDVDDATGEVFRRAIEGMPRLESSQRLRPWVVGIARHVALDVLRARRLALRRASPDRLPGAIAYESASDVAAQIADRGASPLEALESLRIRRAVADALARLPYGARDALTLFHLEGRSYQEIAARLGVPVGTVATWVARGRKALSSMLDREDAP